MDAIRDLMWSGGPFMWPLLAAVPIALGLAILRYRTARTHALPGLGLALVVGIVGVGIMGAIQGEIQGFDAVAHAAEPVKQTMMEAVLRISLIPLQSAAVLAAVVAAIFGATSMRARDVDRPPSKGANTARWSGRMGAFFAAAGVILFFLQRGEFATVETLTGMLMASAFLGLGAFLAGFIGTVAALVSGFAGRPAVASAPSKP